MGMAAVYLLIGICAIVTSAGLLAHSFFLTRTSMELRLLAAVLKQTLDELEQSAAYRED